MPLTESVGFSAVLQRGNRIQVPRLFRWQYKIEANEVLKVKVMVAGCFVVASFLARISKDGRLKIQRLTLKLLKRVRSEAWKTRFSRLLLNRQMKRMKS